MIPPLPAESRARLIGLLVSQEDAGGAARSLLQDDASLRRHALAVEQLLASRAVQREPNDTRAFWFALDVPSSGRPWLKELCYSERVDALIDALFVSESSAQLLPFTLSSCLREVIEELIDGNQRSAPTAAHRIAPASL
ncbi:hypothetical protein ATCC90586_011459 [Pythium insidiosum]|nr:hypothetical protein ATCC90586_011459 [Pythium insidiosum]